MSQSSQLSTDNADKPVIPVVNYLNADRGVWSWLTTIDHKRIGVMYLVSVLMAFLLGGIFAMALRLELLTPGPTIMGANTYNRMFTLHGVVMIFLFMIPAIPGVFGNFMLPLMLGAKDVAFPKLNLLSLYLYWTGATLALSGMIMGGTDTGWTFYAPYSTTTPMTLFPVLLGVFILGFSSILTGLNFIVTIHTLRAPGMGWMRLQLFVWAIYATSIIQVLATPVIGLTVMLVGIEKVGALRPVRSEPGRRSGPVPAHVLVLLAPGRLHHGAAGHGRGLDAISAFSRKNIFGYKMIAYSSLGIAFVGFFAWGHHMFVSGQSSFDNGAFAVISMFVGVFTAIKVFNWVATLYRGSIAIKAPLIYICGFLFFVVFGGMTGIAVATVSLDVHWHDTYFVIAHFHFIMVGAVIMAFLIALHYWFPKMFGRMYHEGWAMVAAALIVLGFNATFIPQFLLGNAGMPRRYYIYPERFQALNVASTAGASLLAFGFVIILIYLIYALVRGKLAGDNPWDSRGYEWMTTSPPPKHNFDVTPVITQDSHSYQEPGEEVEHVVI